MDNTYARALVRFWWIVAVGVGVAALAGAEMAASLHLGFPPKVTWRTPPRYTATQLLLVNSAADPYLRTAVTNVVPRPSKVTLVKQRSSGTQSPPASAGTGTLQSVPQPPTVSLGQPNVEALVRAANFFPRVIESDQVLALRRQMFGPLHGTVAATALNAFQSPTRYRPGSFPVIELNATARRPGAAIELARATSLAFMRWVKLNQNGARVPPAERILIEDLQKPRRAAASGGPKMGLPIFVALVVLAVFAGIAIVVDRSRPQLKPAKTPSRRTRVRSGAGAPSGRAHT